MLSAAGSEHVGLLIGRYLVGASHGRVTRGFLPLGAEVMGLVTRGRLAGHPS